MSRGFPLQDTGPGMSELFHDLQIEQEQECSSMKHHIEQIPSKDPMYWKGVDVALLHKDVLIEIIRQLYLELEAVKAGRDR